MPDEATSATRQQPRLPCEKEAGHTLKIVRCRDRQIEFKPLTNLLRRQQACAIGHRYRERSTVSRQPTAILLRHGENGYG
jgi:hypothetical protein